jgi:hypothetical protein
MAMSSPRVVRLPRLLVSLWPLLVACSSAPSATTAPVEWTPAALPHARAFVWTTRTLGDAPVTYFLSDAGEVTTQVPGIYIAAAGTEWTWQETSETVATVACDEGLEQPAAESRASRVLLVASDAAHDPMAIVVPPDGDDANEIQHSARLLASVGPYLFVEESTYAYTCGAHGQTGVSFAVWNIDDRSTVDLLAELPHRDRLMAAGKRAIDADADETGFGNDADPPALTELVPRIGPRGHLEATALVTVPSCYACTRGGWSSYTSSTPVAAELPARLRDLGPVPQAVAVFAEGHRELSIGGYSVR